MDNTETKTEIFKQIKEQQIVSFSTSEDKQPRTRPVILHYIDDKFWIVTQTSTPKVKQITDNPKVEFLLYLENKDILFKSGYIRAEGTANIVQDKDIKQKTGEKAGIFPMYFPDANDPRYTLIEIIPRKIEYLRTLGQKPITYTY